MRPIIFAFVVAVIGALGGDPLAGYTDEQLESKIKASLEREQHLAEQLHASEASASWLAGQLHNATSQVHSALAKQSQAEQVAAKDEALATSKDSEVSKQGVEVQKLRAHQSWLGSELKKLLVADKEMQNRTIKLQGFFHSLQEENAEFAMRSEDLTKENDAEARALAEQKKTNLRQVAQRKSIQADKEALQTAYGMKETALQQEIAQLRERAAANISVRDATIRELQGEVGKDQRTRADLEQNIQSVEKREKEAEDKQAETAAEIKQVMGDKQTLGGQLGQGRADVARLQQAMASLQAEVQELQGSLEREHEAKKRAEGETCKTLQREVADVENAKAHVHRALDKAVKLGRKEADKNKELRRAMGQTKRQLASILRRESDETTSMHKEIIKLHQELQTRHIEEGQVQPRAARRGSGTVAPTGDAFDAAVADLEGEDAGAAGEDDPGAGASLQDRANLLEQQALTQAAAAVDGDEAAQGEWTDSDS